MAQSVATQCNNYHYTQCQIVFILYAVCSHGECHYAECHSADCDGTQFQPFISKSFFFNRPQSLELIS
jgi:hypothetical protein